MKFFTEGLTHFIKEALKWPELKVHCDKIRGLEARFMDARSYLYKTDSDYNVLNHGDFHMRNFMCKIVDNSIKHIIMVRDRVQVTVNMRKFTIFVLSPLNSMTFKQMFGAHRHLI